MLSYQFLIWDISLYRDSRDFQERFDPKLSALTTCWALLFDAPSTVSLGQLQPRATFLRCFAPLFSVHPQVVVQQQARLSATPCSWPLGPHTLSLRLSQSQKLPSSASSSIPPPYFSAVSTLYLSFLPLKAALTFSSHRTVSSIINTAQAEVDHRVMSGLREDVVISGGNFSPVLRSCEGVFFF